MSAAQASFYGGDEDGAQGRARCSQMMVGGIFAFPAIFDIFSPQKKKKDILRCLLSDVDVIAHQDSSKQIESPASLHLSLPTYSK